MLGDSCPLHFHIPATNNSETTVHDLCFLNWYKLDFSLKLSSKFKSRSLIVLTRIILEILSMVVTLFARTQTFHFVKSFSSTFVYKCGFLSPPPLSWAGLPSSPNAPHLVHPSYLSSETVEKTSSRSFPFLPSSSAGNNNNKKTFWLTSLKSKMALFLHNITSDWFPSIWAGP